MDDFYDSLHEYSKQVFDILKYRPKDDYDANNFLIKRCRLNDLDDIYVHLKQPVVSNGKMLKLVRMTAKNPFSACIPQVWQNMSTNQQLRSLIRLYNYFFKKIVGDKPDQPTLMFFTNYKLIDTVISACFFKENYIYFPLHKMLYSDECITLTSTLVHEIEHFRQEYERRDLAEWLKQNDYDFSKLTKNQKHLFFSYSNHIETKISNFYNFRGEKLFNYMMAKCKFTKENIDLWIKLEEDKDSNWILVKQLAYDFCYKEVLSQDIESKVLKELFDKYAIGAYKLLSYESKRMQDVNTLKSAGFDLDETAIQNITNLGNLANMVDDEDNAVYFDILNYLLEVYKAKKVDKPFIENYDEFEDEYFKSQQRALLKQRDKKIENEKGSEVNELWFF